MLENDAWALQIIDLQTKEPGVDGHTEKDSDKCREISKQQTFQRAQTLRKETTQIICLLMQSVLYLRYRLPPHKLRSARRRAFCLHFVHIHVTMGSRRVQSRLVPMRSGTRRT